MQKISSLINKTYRHFMHDSLYRNSIFLIMNTLALAGLGFIFWIVAARLYPSSSVGVISAIVSASNLLATLSFFGFDYALIKFIPGSNKATVRTDTGLTFAAIMSIVAATLYLFLIPVIVPKAHFLDSSVWWMLGFTAFIIATTWNTLTNSVFIAHRVAQYALMATILLGLLRLPLVYFFKPHGQAGLLTAYILALIASVLFCFIFLRTKVNYSYRLRISRKELRHMSSYALGTYLSNVSGGLPALILPTIILRMLGAGPAAYFYIASLLSSLLYIIPNTTSQSLFAEGALDVHNLDTLLVKAAKLISTFVIPGFILMATLGWLLLSIFGKAYAANGYWLLFFLALTAIPKIASYIFSTVLRIHSRIKPVVVVATIGTIIQIVGSYIGMRITSHLITLGIAALACEIFVASSYAVLFYRYRKQDTLA